MYPDEKQKESINKTIGCSRFIYNYFLNDKIKEYKKPVDRYYPSSRIRNICNYQNKEVKDLSIRKWEYPICHTNHDRDYNASVNIMFKGLEKYMLYLKQHI